MPVPMIVLGCAGNGVLLTVSDVCAQLIERGRTRRKYEQAVPHQDGPAPVIVVQPYDYTRTLRFACIGIFLTGPLTYMRYGVLAQLFGEAASPQAAVQKMLCNQLLFDPPETLIHLAGLEWFRSDGDWDAVTAKCKADYWSIQIPSWCIAFPVNVCTFALWSSVWEQMLFQRSVSTCFNVYFSYVANRPVRKGADAAADEVEPDTEDAGSGGGPQGGVSVPTTGRQTSPDGKDQQPGRFRRRLWRRMGGGGHRRGPQRSATTRRAPAHAEVAPPPQVVERKPGVSAKLLLEAKSLLQSLSAAKTRTFGFRSRHARPDECFLGAVCAPVAAECMPPKRAAGRRRRSASTGPMR
eukprot:TRINITY_DN14584_c0_g1_i1.p1 TRINITY_DN14584_c0_g1~~TRINITY_DN14584_c0_g1_i1.p1  ORF type:complete len:377 (+),score=94.80 TRINITY_DN14584_c0_g1_i1:77-1132(+)